LNSSGKAKANSPKRRKKTWIYAKFRQNIGARKCRLAARLFLLSGTIAAGGE
jgi:hypothetical protein